MTSKKSLYFLLFFSLVLGIFALGYFIPRTSFFTGFLVFTGLFILYYLLYLKAGTLLNLKKVLLYAFILRISLLFSLPQWSEDYVRFVWDGQLIVLGHNPYETTPQEF